jgi:hypothetical protein
MESRLIFLRRLGVVETREDREGQTGRAMDVSVQACRRVVYDYKGPSFNAER